MNVDFDRASELLEYDSGDLVWKVDKGPRAKTGDVAGTLDHTGYVHITIDGKTYLAHRLVWLLTYGSWPEDEIDHINKDPDDNRLENLRIANRSQACANRGSYGKYLKGVNLIEGKYWIAQITKDKKTIYLGAFPTELEAHQAYVSKAIELHGEYAFAG